MSKKGPTKKALTKDLALIKEELRRKIASKECILEENTTNTSKAWKNFKIIKEASTGKGTGYVNCNHCKGIFKHDSSATGTSHLHKHSETCMNRRPPSTTETVDAASASTTISKFFKPKTVVTKKIKGEMLNAAMAFCAYDMRPFEAVKGRGLEVWTDKAMMIAIKYGLIPTKDMTPHPTTVSRNIRRLANTLRESKVPFYQEAMKQGICAATTDMWTDDFQKHSYTAVTLHYTDSDWVLYRKVLFTYDYPEDKRKTGECLREDLANKFKSLGFDMDVVNEMTFVTDQGPNIVKALSLHPPIERMNCCAHMLNTVLKHIFQSNTFSRELPNVYQTLITSKALVAFLKHSGISSRLTKTVHQEVETRWNTRLAMLKSVRDNHTQITTILKERPKDIYRLDGINLTALSVLIDFLQPFKTASDIFEADRCTIHSVVPQYLALLNFCKPPQPADDDLTQIILSTSTPTTNQPESTAQSEESDLSTQSHTYNDIMSTLKIIGYEQLTQKFTINDTHRMATLLSPVAKDIGLRQRSYCMSMTQSERDRAINKLRQRIQFDSEGFGDSEQHLELSQAATHGLSDESFPATPCSSASATPPVKRKKREESPNRHIIDIMTALHYEEEGETLDLDEVDKYINSKFNKAEAGLDVLQWWRRNEDTYPKLAKVARTILCIPASSAASERVFSAAGNIVEDKRSCILPDTVDALLFLASNAETKDFNMTTGGDSSSDDEDEVL